MTRRLDVLINDQVVGELREENNLWQFEYGEAWRRSPQGFDLSPALPRELARQIDGATARPVQWYFDNLLPEEALRTILAKEARIDADDAFGLLAFYGEESAGALVLRAITRTAGDHELPERGIRLLPLDELNRRILDLPHSSLIRSAPKRMSLAGAQHKLLVIHQHGNLFEPLAGTPSTHILKPSHPGTDYPASVMNEYFVMRLAGAVGLDVPPVYLKYAPEPVYIVERFDRFDPSGKPLGQGDANPDAVQRRHVIDTCQLLNKARNFKYSAANLDSLAQAVALCRSKAAARLQLFRWLLFNVLVGNSDNHLKNISFIVSDEGIRIAPCYDLLSTAVYETRALANEKAQWPATPLTLPIGNATTFAAITLADLLAAGHQLGLPGATAKREIERMLRTIQVRSDVLIAQIESSLDDRIAEAPDSGMARRHVGGELRVLRAIRTIVLADMCRQLSDHGGN